MSWAHHLYPLIANGIWLGLCRWQMALVNSNKVKYQWLTERHSLWLSTQAHRETLMKLTLRCLQLLILILLATIVYQYWPLMQASRLHTGVCSLPRLASRLTRSVLHSLEIKVMQWTWPRVALSKMRAMPMWTAMLLLETIALSNTASLAGPELSQSFSSITLPILVLDTFLCSYAWCFIVDLNMILQYTLLSICEKTQ